MPAKVSLGPVFADDLDDAVAERMGFKSAARMRELAAIPEEELESFLELRRHQKSLHLPEQESRTRDLRDKRVAEATKNASERSYSVRERSVAIGHADCDQSAKDYLRDCYSLDDGIMICQICRTELPFKLDNEDYYFEAVDFLGDEKAVAWNHLALCPNHAAMFKHANGSKEDLRQLLVMSTTATLSIILGRKETPIHFHSKHIGDLQAAFLRNTEEDHATP